MGAEAGRPPHLIVRRAAMTVRSGPRSVASRGGGGSILLVALWHGLFNLVSGTAAATGVLAAVVRTVVMAQALLLVALDLQARRRGRPSPPAALHRSGARLERSRAV